MRKRILSLVLVISIISSFMVSLPIAVNAETVASGTCGDGLSWTLDEDGIFEIRGIGVIPSYNSLSSVPWDSIRANIKKVVIGDGVTGIGKIAFSHCVNLTSVIIPNSVTSIGDSAFSTCRNLTSITIPNSVTIIGYDAFFYCDSLTSINIPNSVIAVGVRAFGWCKSLTNMTIGRNVTSIGDSTFWECTSLENILVDSNNMYYSNDSYGILYNKDKTELIQYPPGNKRAYYSIPKSVTTIGYGAFAYCKFLKSISIPNSVTKISDAVFWLCRDLENIKIPNSVTSISDHMFYSCTSLTSITLPNSIKSIEFAAFSSCISLIDVCYYGTEQDWKNISISSSNDILEKANIRYEYIDKNDSSNSTSTNTCYKIC